jgi:hypothetical protein
MRPLVSYILLLAILLPTLSPWGTVAYYHANKDYIARVLCVNRAKPQLHCDGQCYLAKKLKAQQDRQDKETTERVQQTASIQLFWQDTHRFIFASPGAMRSQPVFAYQPSLYRAPARGLLKPPCRSRIA